MKPKMEIVVEVDLTTVRSVRAREPHFHPSLTHSPILSMNSNTNPTNTNPKTDPEKILSSSVSRQRQRSLARIQEEHEQHRDAATKVL